VVVSREGKGPARPGQVTSDKKNESESPSHLERNQTISKFPKPLQCAVAKGKLFSETPSTIRLRPLEEVSRGSLDVPISKIMFGVPSFPEFLGHDVIETLPLGGCEDWKPCPNSAFTFLYRRRLRRSSIRSNTECSGPHQMSADVLRCPVLRSRSM